MVGIIFILLFFLQSSLFSTSLDGTSSVIYKQNHYTFSDGDSVTGFVKLAGGFTIPEASTVTFNTPHPVSSGIDLRTTGTLKLEGDIYFDSSVTLSSGGYIYGGEKTIYLGGDLVIPDEQDLIFCFSCVIDGNGHDLEIGRWAQILIDSDVSVTFKNLRIKNSVNSHARPVIRCMDWYSSLILDNVTLALKDDFEFRHGNIFFYNDVVFTGTSQFIYRSVLPSYIEPHSTLYFDDSTSFNYYPSSSSNSLITFIDGSSSMYFSGATLKTTETGIRLTKGKMFLDNHVVIDNEYVKTFSDLSITDSKYYLHDVNVVAWNLDGTYLAAGSNNEATETIIYKNNGGSLSVAASVNFDTAVYGFSWSPDNRFISMTGAHNPDIEVYEFDGSSLTKVDGIDSFNSNVRSARWSPDGRFMAACGYNANIVMYSWDGVSLKSIYTLLLGTVGGDYLLDVCWSPDGLFLAVGGYFSTIDDLIIYSWNGTSLTKVTSKPFGSGVAYVEWSPDGNYLAVGGDNGSSDLVLYYWDGSSLTQKDTLSFGSGVYSLSWSVDGRYLSIGGNNSNTDFVLYELKNDTLTTLTAYDFSTCCNYVDWSPDDNYIAVGGANSTDNLILYEIAYTTTNANLSESNSIIFGDSSREENFDFDVKLLSASRVDIKGLVYDDSYA